MLSCVCVCCSPLCVPCCVFVLSRVYVRCKSCSPQATPIPQWSCVCWTPFFFELCVWFHLCTESHKEKRGAVLANQSTFALLACSFVGWATDLCKGTLFGWSLASIAFVQHPVCF